MGRLVFRIEPAVFLQQTSTQHIDGI